MQDKILGPEQLIRLFEAVLGCLVTRKQNNSHVWSELEMPHVSTVQWWTNRQKLDVSGGKLGAPY